MSEIRYLLHWDNNAEYFIRVSSTKVAVQIINFSRSVRAHYGDGGAMIHVTQKRNASVRSMGTRRRWQSVRKQLRDGETYSLWGISSS